MLCFTLGFIFGIIVRHWLDLHEIPQKEPHEAVDEAYGASEVIHTTYPQRPTAAYTSYPCAGGDSTND